MQRPLPRGAVARAVSVGALALAACAVGAWGCTPPPADSSADVSGLPEFTPAEAALFDDTIGVGVFGSELEEVSPAADPKLHQRTAHADVVVPVSVSTVTRDRGGEVESYTIVVTPTGQALAGTLSPEPLEMQISDNSPSFPFVKSADAGMVGQKLILFLKRYRNGGSSVVHWRLEADSNEIRKAIQDARALDEIAQ